MKLVVACSKLWIPTLKVDLEKSLDCEVFLLQKREELSAEFLKTLQPDFVFFPHWSYLIAPEIYENFNCIMFHMTDLPFGRGGSPLQNLIVRGFERTKISAFKCDGGLDTGPIFLKRDLELNGSAQQIYLRANVIIMDMICEIVQKKVHPVSQTGEITEFKRRTPEDGDLKNLSSLNDIYNYIRMLDAENYPQAFLEFSKFKLEFSDAALSGGEISARVKIKIKGEA